MDTCTILLGKGRVADANEVVLSQNNDATASLGFPWKRILNSFFLSNEKFLQNILRILTFVNQFELLLINMHKDVSNIDVKH